ncbi:MAG: lipoprotein-releasing ABC transporter permease subunit, partial [Pseudomonadota bacterium]|nr:lipoprotein-releasing ABC transporter permease subunit [Pseudomonadota bacterium]
GHLLVQPVETPLDDYAEVAGRIAKVPGILSAIPFVEGQVMASSANSASGGLVRGLSEADLKKQRLVAGNVRQGTFDGFDRSGGVAIGSRLAQSLGLGAGDSITLVSPRGAVTPFGTTPRIKSYPVAAVFEIGMSEYDSLFVFMPLAEAQLYFNMTDRATAIEVFTDDPDRVEHYAAQVTAAAQRPVFILDWRQRNATFFGALQVERNVMFLILTLIVLVAALNIVSGLIMLVKDKGRDIAILRTMGATRAAVMRIFLITGASIGVVGTMAGFVLGLLVCLNIKSIQGFLSWVTGQNIWDPTVRFLSQIPADMDPGETTTVVVMSLVLSFLATLYPSWRAARLDPVEALRYE